MSRVGSGPPGRGRRGRHASLCRLSPRLRPRTRPRSAGSGPDAPDAGCGQVTSVPQPEASAEDSGPVASAAERAVPAATASAGGIGPTVGPAPGSVLGPPSRTLRPPPNPTCRATSRAAVTTTVHRTLLGSIPPAPGSQRPPSPLWTSRAPLSPSCLCVSARSCPLRRTGETPSRPESKCLRASSSLHPVGPSLPGGRLSNRTLEITESSALQTRRLQRATESSSLAPNTYLHVPPPGLERKGSFLARKANPTVNRGSVS